MRVITDIWLAVQAQAQVVYFILFFKKKDTVIQRIQHETLPKEQCGSDNSEPRKKIHDNYIPNRLQL